MKDYKTCARNLRGECPMADSFANHPRVTLDCKNCKSYEKAEPIAAQIFNAENARDKHDAVSPSHYKQGGIECKDCIKAALGEHYIGFLIGNVIKYTYRYQHKNGVEDLKKAAVYLDWAIKELSNDEE